MSYQKYGISSELVTAVKAKMKNKAIKERVKSELEGVTKADLQSSDKVGRMLRKLSAIVGVKIDSAQSERIVRFVIAQKIDPKNTLHLLRIWAMFR